MSTQSFYDRAYSHAGEEGLRFGAWRDLTARGKAERLLRALAELPESGVTLLDVGCGDGALLVELARRRPRWETAGVELAPAAARIARERLPGVAIRTYDGGRLPWPDSSFEVAVLSHVLEHVAEPVATLREMARVSNLLVIEVPLERNLSAARASKRGQARAIGHVRRLARRDVRVLLAAAHLEARAELTGTLSRHALRFFAASAPGRLRADLKWALQRALHRAAPRIAERLFTLQYVVVAAPTSASAD